MKTKKILLGVSILIIAFIVGSMQNIVFATNATTPLYLGITELRTNSEPNMGYSINNPNAGGKYIWNILEYTGEGDNASLKADGHKNIYCVKAGVGFSNLKRRATYNVFYDMKTEKEKIKQQNDVLKSIVEGTIKIDDNTFISKYDALLSLGDMLYLPKESKEQEKEDLLKTIRKLAETDEFANTFISEMESYPLTDDDINAVQQTAMWYFTNYGEEAYDKTAKDSWLTYKTEQMTEYTSLSDYNLGTNEGRIRNAQATVLYKYLIKTAKANANNYSNSSAIGAPAKINTTTLNYEEVGENYVIGPINITEVSGNTKPYTIDFKVKNSGNETDNYKLLDSNKKEVAQGTTVKDLVGKDFYISMPKETTKKVGVSISINYSNSKLTLWASTTDNQAQPVMIPEKEEKSENVDLEVTPNEKPFDLALRKYITKINDKELTGTNSRVPVIDESTLTSGTTATYKHKKDPVLVEKGNKVTYKLAIYNEGQKAGRATKIVDQLPTGLKFSKIVSGNFVLDSYDDAGNNTLTLKRKANNTDNLAAYTSGNLSSEIVEIECEVTATPDTVNKKVLTNVAWISEEFDSESNITITNQNGADRDSEPSTKPSVNKDNMENYSGNSNKEDLSDSNYYYKGQQDDDDFEKLVLMPESFDLKLVKRIVAVNGQSVPERIRKIDVSKLNTLDENGNLVTEGNYDVNTEPVAVKKGDIVTYTFRIYNEGTIDGYASEITEDIPSGLQFLWSEKEDEELAADTTLTKEEKDAIAFNQSKGWTYKDSELTKIRTSCLDIYEGQPAPNNGTEDKREKSTKYLIKAFGANDGTKTEKDLDYKEVSVMLKVVSENVTGTIIRNEACISEDSDKDGNPIDDRDSDPKKWVKYEDDEDYDNIILKSFDLALRKFIIAVSDDTKIENSEYLKNTDGSYKRAPDVDTSKLNTKDENGKTITTATYNHTKEPVEVKKNDIVVYMLRVYNEGEIDGYAAEIKDHLPSNLEFVDGDFNKQYGWTVSEDGRTVTTKYLEDAKISKAVKNENPTTPEKTYTLSYKEVPIMCKVKDTAKADEKITNIADITKYLDEDKKSVIDRDSAENNVKLPDDNTLPNYKDNETGNYIPGQEDDDDFEKVIIKKFDLALRKQIVSINHTYAEKETEYNDRYAKLDTDKKQTNTIYDYYDVESNIPTVVENDVVKYSIRVYNEGKIDGTATWVTDILPSGLEYLKDNEVNKKYGWKAFKESSADNENAVKIGEKYYEEVDFDSKEITLYATNYLKDTTIKAYTGEGEASYGEVFMATRVKSKKEVAEGTEYKLRNVAEIGDDNGDDDDSVPGDGSEWKDQDDVDIEDLKLVEFDLALRKWVTQAIVIENGKQTVTETGHQPYDDPEQVVKVELNRKKLNQVTVKFKYSIRVINEGDIAGYAKEVKDYVPEGLKFVAEDNPGWTDLGNNVISTNLLENTLLQPGEYADVEVVLTWINSENNMGVMTNTAEISKDYNEYHVPDRDSTPDNKKPGEDDIDDAPVMLSISTGQMRIYFTLGFIVLVTVAGGVVLIRKYVL